MNNALAVLVNNCEDTIACYTVFYISYLKRDLSAVMTTQHQLIHSLRQENMRSLARSPIEVYKGILHTRLTSDSTQRIERLTQQFSDVIFAGQPLSVYLLKFILTICRLIASIELRPTVTNEDISAAVDTLEYFASTTRWDMSRDQPGFIIRPASQASRQVLRSMGSVEIGLASLNRINSATEKLAMFLEEHRLGSSKEYNELCDCISSVWVLLSGLACYTHGRTVVNEADFEIAYDITRILLFYTPVDEFKTLTAVRIVGTSPHIPRLATVEITLGFEKMLESSAAARLESVCGEQLLLQNRYRAGLLRLLLTNSIRFLSQLVAARHGRQRIDAQDYVDVVSEALALLDSLGLPSTLLRDEQAVLRLYQRLVPSRALDERISLLTRQLETLIIRSSSDKDILLSNQSLVPRLLSLIILLAGGTDSTAREELTESDLKRGLRTLSKAFVTDS